MTSEERAEVLLDLLRKKADYYDYYHQALVAWTVAWNVLIAEANRLGK